ncbi:hypothetical protein FBY06_13850 [Pseudomonas sp. SJZ085]|nr:hypothetical protein FBX99_1372 [Pseudomonas sp. SJZ074]TWC30919.1 hypothetical protein FBY06_13850 [Pseudomonas sp. SJZ085]
MLFEIWSFKIKCTWVEHGVPQSITAYANQGPQYSSQNLANRFLLTNKRRKIYRHCEQLFQRKHADQTLLLLLVTKLHGHAQNHPVLTQRGYTERTASSTACKIDQTVQQILDIIDQY